MKREDSYPLMSIAVTWDRKQGFRVWKEKDINKLVKYISKFPYIVGANLMGFDYQVLENYVPKVRSSLGRKTIDILTHARWGSVVRDIEDIFDMLSIQFEGEPESDHEWHDYFQLLRTKIMCYGLTLDKKYRFVPDMNHNVRFSNEVGISLANLASVTLGKKKRGKSVGAPELFRSGKYKELISYCKSDVLLTRNIFIYGVRKGFVKNRGFTYNLPVWWKELVKHLVDKPVKGKSSISEANNFAWQINHVKSSIDFRIKFYVSDWKPVIHKVVSSYDPFGSYPSAEERKIIAELIEQGVID